MGQTGAPEVPETTSLLWKNFMEMNCTKSLERSNLKLCYLKFKMRSGVILCATDACIGLLCDQWWGLYPQMCQWPTTFLGSSKCFTYFLRALLCLNNQMRRLKTCFFFCKWPCLWWCSLFLCRHSLGWCHIDTLIHAQNKKMASDKDMNL